MKNPSTPKKQQQKKKKNADRSDNTSKSNKSKDLGERREIQKNTGKGSRTINITGYLKITKENSTKKLLDTTQQLDAKEPKQFRNKIWKRENITKMLNG